MMFKEELIGLLAKETKFGKGEISRLIEIPPDEKLGDYAFPCFVLARHFKKSPAQIAAELKGKIKLPKEFSRVEAAGPYLNFFVDNARLAEGVLNDIVKSKDKYGRRLGQTGKKKTAMVEFFHANTHKGVHIGHLRNISLGEAICRLLEAAGNKVVRVNYQGDIGPHVAKCIWGYLRFKEKEPKQNKGTWLGHIYARAHKLVEGNEKLENEVREINKKLYAKDKKLVEVWKKTRKWCLDDFNYFYKEFGVKFERLYFESEAEGVGKNVVLDMLKKGIASQSEGAIVVDLENYGLGLYVAITKDGNPTYQAKELGLALIKQKEFKFDSSLHVVGSEQELFFKQVFKTYELLESPMAEKSKHIAYGLVMLPEGKMSSREGTLVLYDELFEKMMEMARKEIKERHKHLSAAEAEERAKTIAFGAMRYSMLSRENNKNFVFDWEQALQFEGDTGPYLQYAHARACNVLKKARREKKEKVGLHVDYGLFAHEHEIKLIKKLAKFNDAVSEAALSYHPHIVAHYLNELAQAFSEFYHTCPVISEVETVMRARLLLVDAVRQVLENGLRLLGINAPKEM